MFKHPVSAAFRLLPALCWLIAAAVCAWMSARLSLLLLTPDKWDVPDRPWPELVFVCGFVGVAIYSVRMAYKEYKEALPAIRADVQLATKLGATGTPTFYLNGIKLGSLRPAYLDAAFQHFLKKSGPAS